MISWSMVANLCHKSSRLYACSSTLSSLKQTTMRTLLSKGTTNINRETWQVPTVRDGTVRYGSAPSYSLLRKFPIGNLRSYKYPFALIYYTCTRTYGTVRYGTLDWLTV